ncbi:succinylglutamate desuccinylase/aspartoacylase family protein [Bacteriovorax sp. BAL6_X]|uniref:succinylglutamate desuccinylase/aspartoacylase domain-containing protein n=1 Tax=Bacteriovorax sp. BAL6_X TaxID=1201290 RepID=UPI0003866285|nr:succinylglutamate desuccinylase/aspartoacylase family protein [Bacteriovorax sp. BAL6_X]EPZ51387.1 succinylglutamate desuccinylase/aspartoacylase family protein [Bacteriovorax sp. BAL6_X]
MSNWNLEKKIINIDETNHAQYQLNIYDLVPDKVDESAPTIYIQANVHGAELQGNMVIFKLLNLLEDEHINARIRMVPNANPYATSIKMGTYTYGRFNPITGDNWNRMYLNFFDQKEGQGLISEDEIKACENKQAYKKLLKAKIIEYRNFHKAYGIDENKNLFIYLQELASDADIVLDLHTAGVGCRYIYGPDFLEEKMAELNFPFHLVIPPEFGGAMDEASFYPWVKFHETHKSENTFEAYTLELGSEELIDSKAGQIDAINIFNYLIKRGVIDADEINTKKNTQYFCELKNYKGFFAPSAGFIEYHKAPGEMFKKGEKVMSIYHFDKLESLEEVISPILAPCDGIVINHAPSSNVKRGMNILEAFTQFKSK